VALTQAAEAWEGSEKVEYPLLDFGKVKSSFVSSSQNK